MHKPLAQALVIIAAAAVASDEPSSGRRLAARRGRRRPTRKNEFDECEAIVDDDAFDFGGARRFAASKSSDECGPAAARTSAAVSAESSRGRRVWLTGLRAVRSTANEPFHCFRSRVGGKVVGIVSCCLGRHSVHS